MSTFYTDRKSDKEMFNYTNEFVTIFPTCLNKSWKEWLITCININHSKIFIEHDLPISEVEISRIQNIIEKISNFSKSE